MKSKAQKRIEAQERQERYDNLSFGEKINQIAKRPGKSIRETQKLYADEIQKNGGKS